MGRVLVTGANGFVGSATVVALQLAGWEVCGTVRRVDGAVSIPLKVVADMGGMDVEGWRSILTDVDVVVHLAARAHVLQETAVDPLAEFRRVNTQGARVLMEGAIAAGVRRLVFVSSIGVNGDVSDDLGFDESSPVAPGKDYAVSNCSLDYTVKPL